MQAPRDYCGFYPASLAQCLAHSWEMNEETEEYGLTSWLSEWLNHRAGVWNEGLGEVHLFLGPTQPFLIACMYERMKQNVVTYAGV